MSYLNSKFQSGFSPQNIPGLVVWLDAADSNSITQSGGAISLWKDRSPNALDVSQNTGAAQPTYETNVQNGLPAVRFTTSQMMQSTQNFTVDKAQTWFVSFKSLAGTNFFFVEQGPNTNTSDGQFLYGANNSIMYMKRGGATRFIDDSIGRGTSPFALNTWYVAGLSTSNSTGGAGDTYWSINGVSRATTLTGTISGSATNALYINNTARVPASNYYGEIIIYNQALSSNQMRLVERYLANKWGVTLSNTHPYFSVPATLRPFNPLDISGCNLWLDAADYRTFDISGTSNVSRWKDKTGLSNDVVVHTGTPTYSSGARPSVYLNGSSSLSNSTTTNAVFTGFYVVYKTSATGPIFTTSTAGVGYTGFFPRENGTTTIARSDTAWYSQASTIFDNTSNLLTVQYDSASNIYVWLNGALNLSSTVSGTITRDNFFLGVRYIPNYNYITGNYYEVIHFNRAISTFERQQVELYLADKWGLRGNLSTSNAIRLYGSLTPAFSPALLSNCALWLDAADYSSFTFSSGTVVSQWNDKSGNGRNFAQATVANQPTWSNSFLSSPGVYFNSANSQRLSGTYVQAGTGGRHTYIVFYDSNTTANLYGNPPLLYMADSNSTGAGADWRAAVDASNNYLSIDIFAGAKTMRTSPNVTSMRTQRCIALWGMPTGATVDTTYVYGNGTQFTTTVASVNLTQTINTFNTSLTTIGGYAVGSSWVNAVISEIIHYSNELTSSQRQLVEGYLANKWGLASSLPSNHPYRTIRV